MSRCVGVSLLPSGLANRGTLKVIMATNRADTLDPALLRPGRLDRKIEFPLPSRREKRLIFQTITGKMNLGPEVDLEDCKPLSTYLPSKFFTQNIRLDVSRPDKLSSAEIASITQAAGLQGRTCLALFISIPLIHCHSV